MHNRRAPRKRSLLDIAGTDIHSPHMRRAGRDLLSLALMDARNHLLRWMTVFEDARAPLLPGVDPLPWTLGHTGWFQERWIARNVHRQRGAAADPTAPRLASLLADADRRYDPGQSRRDERRELDLLDGETTRQYLADTMEVTLDLLDSAEENDEGLYFFRLALFREDMQVEALAEAAQTLGVPLGDAASLLGAIASVPPREPLLFPATRWPLGSAPGGFVFDNEKWAHAVEVPEFDIDAQPVTWAQLAEFADDGGYDDASCWSGDGCDWLQREGRRAPRHVDQLRRGVLQQRFGRLSRVPAAQPALHVSWFEADAWCRWAGRRLPTEVEWEAAAQSYSRGFAWGSVWEWTAGTFRPYPGFAPDPWREYSQPFFGRTKVLRGGSFATAGRMRHTKFRRFAPPDRDDMFCGFRSCAI